MHFLRLPTLPLLRTFDAIAQHGSLTRAADVLGRSQPALTIAMTRLEQSLGVILLDRGRAGSHLTEAGAIFGHRTRRMFERLDEALREVLHPAGTDHHRTDRITDAHARCLAALAEDVTIERAAQALRVTPTSLRRSVRSAERLIDRPLLQRVADVHGLTKHGTVLARRIKLALAEIDAGIEEIEIARGRICSRIAIGIVPLSATRLLTQAVNAFLGLYPAAAISINHGAYDALLDDLRSGRIDLLYGVLRLPCDIVDVREEALFFDPYVVVARRGHPLAGSGEIALSDLACYDWIVPKGGAPRRENLERMFRNSTFEPKVSIETSSLNLQRSLLISSDRLTLLTQQEMEDGASAEMLVALAFEPQVVRGYDGIALRVDWKPTPVQAKFLDLLRLESKAILHRE